jgi:hypothetical protein
MALRTETDVGNQRTFILADVLERKLVAVVLALDNPHLAKRAFAHDAQQADVVEVYCRQLRLAWPLPVGGRRVAGGGRTLVGEDDGLAVGIAHWELAPRPGEGLREWWMSECSIINTRTCFGGGGQSVTRDGVGGGGGRGSG